MKAGGVPPISPTIQSVYNGETRIPFNGNWGDTLKAAGVTTGQVPQATTTSTAGYLPTHPLTSSIYDSMWFHPMTSVGNGQPGQGGPFTFPSIPSMELLNQAAQMYNNNNNNQMPVSSATAVL